MKLTERYFINVKAYKDAAAQIEAEYNAEMERAKRFEGSAGGRELMDKARATRDAALKAERETTGKAIREITAAMRENVKARKISAPTPEQVNILTVLKMRDHLTADEIKQAGNSLAKNPLCLSVLDEIAHSHGLTYTGKRGGMTTATALNHIDNMERSAFTMMQGENGRFNRAPADMGDLLTKWGGFSYTVTTDEWGGQHAVIDQETTGAFAAAVDGEGAEV